MGKATLVEEDLTTARALLIGAGELEPEMRSSGRMQLHTEAPTVGNHIARGLQDVR